MIMRYSQVDVKNKVKVDMILRRTIVSNVFCLPWLSERVPQLIDPITRDMVNMVVINPIWAIFSSNLILIKRGMAIVIMPLFIERSGRSKVNAWVFLFENSFFIRLNNGFFLLMSVGFFVKSGMRRSVRLMHPAMRKVVG